MLSMEEILTKEEIQALDDFYDDESIDSMEEGWGFDYMHDGGYDED